MLHPTYPLLTDRLSLRPFRDEDLDAFHAIQSRPDVVRLRVASDLAIFGLFVASIRLGDWVVLADPAGTHAGEVKAVVEINRWIGLSLTIAAAIALAQLLFEIRREWLDRRGSSLTAGAAVV